MRSSETSLKYGVLVNRSKVWDLVEISSKISSKQTHTEGFYLLFRRNFKCRAVTEFLWMIVYVCTANNTANFINHSQSLFFFFLPSGAMNETNSHEGLHSMSVPGQAKCRINSLWRVEEKRVFEQTAYFFLPLSLCLSSLSARQLRYCLYGDCKGARPDHSARPQTTAHLEWSRRVFKLYPLAPLLFPPLNSTMPPFSLWAALHELETTSFHPPSINPYR